MPRRPPSLQRRNATRSPKKTFVIMCEGKNTEPLYFSMLRGLSNKLLIDINIVREVGVPLTIAKKAAARARAIKRSKDSFARQDRVWAVFDRDEHPAWPQALDTCRRASVELAFSNPCFELWLILHYKDHDAPDDRHQIQRLAGSIVEGYSVKMGKIPDCASLACLIETAENRAEQQCLRRIAEGREEGDAPSTLVWRLTRAIRDEKS